MKEKNDKMKDSMRKISNSSEDSIGLVKQNNQDAKLTNVSLINNSKNSIKDNYNSTSQNYNTDIATKSINNNLQNQKNDDSNSKSFMEDFVMITDSQYFSDDFQQNLTKKFLNEIKSKQEIVIELMGKTMDVLYNNPSYCKILIDSILIEKKNPVIVFKNYHNMHYFANILNSISINLDHHENENYELNFAIIHIAERCYFYEETNGNKFYLCALLSKNKIFNSKNFWMDLIELKLFKKMEINIKKFQTSNNSKLSFFNKP